MHRWQAFTAAILFAASAPLALADSSPPIPRPQSSEPDRRFTVSGEDLGPTDWRAIDAAASRVHFTAPGKIKAAKAAAVHGRYVERLTLANGAQLNYVQLTYDRHYLPTAFDMALRSQTQSDFMRQRHVEFDAAKVKWAGHLQYLTVATDTATCFIYHGALGQMALRGATQETYGNVCYGKAKPAPALEREMLALLASARFPDEEGNYVRSLEIPAPR
jgi:hypothetical protein